MDKPLVSEEDVLAFAKTQLKERGFRKKGKRWTKQLDDFTLVFYVQGSSWSKEGYYIRPGVLIHAVAAEENAPWAYYGHFATEITPCSVEQIFGDLDLFFDTWTDKTRIKRNVLAFLAWKKRNSMELCDADNAGDNEPPAFPKELFAASNVVLDYVVGHC